VKTGARSTAGFMLAPLLYMLALAGVGATVMFSGYSQILKSNAEMTALNTARSQLQAAGQTLSAIAVLDTATSSIVEPPAVLPFASVTGGDVARLPSGYADAGNSGTPTDVGVVDVSSGIRQLDPWGKFYIYCRWENPVATPAAPSLMVMSAGPNGILNTQCGHTSAQGDDRVITSTVAETINRANVWQVASSSQIKFGIDTDAVRVNQDGSMSASSLTLTGGLAAASATISGTLAAGSTTFTGAAISGNATVGGTLGVTGAATFGALTAGAADLDSLTLDTALAITQGGTGATSAGVARTNLGATATGDALFTAADAAAGRTALGATATGSALFIAADAAAGRTALGASAFGSSLFTAADDAAGRAALALGTMAVQNADNVNITGGTIDGVTITGTIDGNVSGSAGSVAASALTGCCVPISAGGTGVATAALALQALGVTGAATPTGNFNLTLLPASGVAAGTYSTVTVDVYGRVTAGAMDAGTSIGEGDSSIEVDDEGDGSIIFTTDGTTVLVVDEDGNVGIGTTDPEHRLDVRGGNIQLSDAAETNRILYFSTAGSPRWSAAANGTAEGGANAGSDFVITRYADNGSAIGAAMSITRSTGNASFSGSVTAVGGFIGNLTGDVTGNISGTITLSDGTVDSPGLYFTNDANTGLWRPGTDTIGLAGGGKDIVRFTGATTAVNYFNISAAATGTALNIAAAGTDSDVSILLSPKGTGGVGIGTTAPAASALVDLTSTSKGFLVPRMDATARDAISTPATGLVVFNTTAGLLQFYDGDSWESVGAGGAIALDDLTDVDTDYATDHNMFLGQGSGAVIEAGSQFNVALGENALAALDIGYENTAIGQSAMLNIGNDSYMNTAVGAGALAGASGLQRVRENTAIGAGALGNIEEYATANTAVGRGAGGSLDHGYDNTLIGHSAGPSITSGFGNIVIGRNNATNLTEGSDNIIIGNSSALAPSADANNTLNIGHAIFGVEIYSMANSRIGIGTNAPAASSVLDLASTAKGFLPPRMNETQRDAISTPATGLVVFNTTAGLLQFYDGDSWESVGTGAGVTADSLDFDDFMDAMTLDASTSIVGTGTNALSIAQSGSVAALTITNMGSGNSFLVEDEASTDTTPFVIDASGNVGIGTTAPSSGLLLDAIQPGSFGSDTYVARFSSTATGTAAVGVMINNRSATDHQSQLVLAAEGTGKWFIGNSSGANTTDDFYIFQGGGGGHRLVIDTSGDVGIGTTGPAASALLDLTSTAKGLLPPRMNTTQRNAISSPAEGLFVYNTGTGALNYYNGSAWVAVGGGENVSLGADTNVNGTLNTAIGYRALANNTWNWNTAVGWKALEANTTGSNNAALGESTLVANTTGANNTALGTNALDSNTEGERNTAVGGGALNAVSTGDNNIALGYLAADNLTEGSNNIVIGYDIDAPSATGSNQLNIGNTIYGNTSAGILGVGSSTLESSAILALTSTARGFLPPRMNEAQRDAIGTPATGLLVYNTDGNTLDFYDGDSWEVVGPAVATVAADSLDFDDFTDAMSLDASTSITADNAEVLSIVNTGSGNSFLVEDAASTDSTPFVINASGDVGIGSATPAVKLDVVGAITASSLVTGTGFAPTANTATGNRLYLPAADTLGLAIAGAGEVQLTGSALSPVTSDGNALGTASLMWSDLFLASGAVINFNNGDVTATHAANGLAFAGASSGYTFDGYVGIGTAASSSELSVGNETAGNVWVYGNDGEAGISVNWQEAARVVLMENGGVGGGAIALAGGTGEAFITVSTSGGLALNPGGEGGVGIGTSSVAASALLDMVSTAQGFLPPRMTEAQRDGISNPATGLVIYNTDDNTLDFYDGDSWEAVGTGVGVAADSLDFDDFTDTMALDASTSITADNAEVLSIVNTGTGNSFLVEDSASTDSSPFVINASGDVGIGSATPAVKLDVVGAITATDVATATGFAPTANTATGNRLYLPAANTVGLAINGAGEVQLTGTALSPVTTDGNALGTSSLMWSDLFVASGAVINFNNGDVTATHAANGLAFAGASSGYTFDAGVGIGTTSVAASALLDMVSTAQGFLPPRMTEAQRDGISSPATGLIIYNTDDNTVDFYDGDSWEVVGPAVATVAADSLDFDDFTDTMALDASTSITADNAEVLSIVNTGSGNSFLVEDEASADATPFVIDASGNVGIGTTAPGAKLHTVVASAAGKGLIVQGAASQTANLQEWQDSTGAALALVNASGHIDLSGTALPNSWNTILKFNAAEAGGFSNGFIRENTGRLLVNFVTNDAANSLFGGGVDGDAVRRFTIGGDGKWSVGSGSAALDTVLSRSTTSTFLISSDSGSGTAHLTVTGGVTAAGFAPTANTATGNRLYLPAADTLGLAIAGAGEVQLTGTALSPVSSDGNALGTSSLMWSDLFLASGAVINFNNGDVTATHAANGLAFAGASSGYTFDAGVGIGTTSVAASALLDMVSTAQGFLPPRMTEAQRDAIATPATGLIVYNTDDNTVDFYDGDSWEVVGPAVATVAADSLDFDDFTDTMALDASTSIAGSGTNALSITQSGSVPALKITNTGSGVSLLVEDAASTDASPFVIDASGNVGIGTTTSSVALTIQASNAVGMKIQTASTNQFNSIVFAESNGAGRIVLQKETDNDFGLWMGTGSAGSESWWNPFTVTTQGLVGIRTSDPGAHLHVAHEDGREGILITSDSQPDGLSLGAYAAGVWIWNNAATPVTFGVGATEAIVIASDGDVGIGTDNPGVKLDVAGAITASSLVTGTGFAPTANTATGNRLYLPASNTLGLAINGAGEVQLDASALSPVTSDGNALGTTSLMWSDLFLASGAVINFNNGDVTITHSADNLAIAGGTLTMGTNGGTNGQITFAGSTSGTVAVRAAAAAGTGTIFQLPADNGTSGYQLTTDGNGVLSWAVAGGAIAIDDLTDAETNYTVHNVFVGQGSGAAIDAGEENVALGEGALGALTDGFSNTAVGYQAADSLTTGEGNTAVGAGALATMSGAGAGGNVAVGAGALYSNPGYASNVAVGAGALFTQTYGNSNVAVGAAALGGNENGDNNVAIGHEALEIATAAYSNVAIGYRVGAALEGGNGNILIGEEAAANLEGGNSNIVIGYDVDVPSVTGDGQLVIGNLIFGTDLDGTGTTISNGFVGIASNAPGYRLELPNTASTSGQGRANAWQTYSDGRFKKDLKPIADALAKVMALKGVTYRSALEVNAKREVGLIAQDVEKVLPEAVSISTTEVVLPGEKPKKVTDYRSLAYDRLAALLVEAIKELKVFADNVAAKVEKLAAKVTGHDAAIKQLQAANDNLRLELKAANDNRAAQIEELKKELAGLKAAGQKGATRP
jgi:CRISPR/Cas system-associated exonuclease Cas4 (RecB family)